MAWWDERSVLAAGPQQVAARSLVAHVDLDCAYLREVVLHEFSRRPGWTVQQPEGDASESVTSSDALFTWAEYERFDWKRVLAGHLHASAYCVRKGLIRKSNLAFSVKKWVSKHPESVLATGVPETLLFEFWDSEYMDEALADVYEVRDMVDGRDWWILKPSMTNQARGILVFNQLEQLKAALCEEGAEDVREWVLQRYIHPPLLVGGRKFHLRVYALAVGALRVYVFRDVLTLFSLAEYSDDPSNAAAHLTNTCRQAPADAQEEAACVGLLSTLPDRLAAVGALPLEEAQRRCATVFADAAALVGETFAAVSSELSFMPLDNAFELFGFDLLVDASWKVWLLEANAEPDFVQTGNALKRVVEGVVATTLQASIDTWFPEGKPTQPGAGKDPVLVFERADPRAQGAAMSFN